MSGRGDTRGMYSLKAAGPGPIPTRNIPITAVMSVKRAEYGGLIGVMVDENTAQIIERVMMACSFVEESLKTRISELEAQLDIKSEQVIEARNPGIDMDSVRAVRASWKVPKPRE